MPKLDRRDFLKFVGASAGAAAAGCSDPVQKLIPYVVQPEEITPGLPVHYASTCTECPAACGLHVVTREGRPIKLEGNPDHPVNRGALCARGQASIGRSYHPDRYRGPLQRDETGELQAMSWDDAAGLLAGRIREVSSHTWLLGGQVGPTTSTWLDRITAAAGFGGRVVYEPFAPEALREASRTLFGSPGEPRFDLSAADLILDLGSDFLETGPSPVEHARQLAEARDAGDPERRGVHLCCVGPRLSMTASSADEWIDAEPGSEGVLAVALARFALATRGAAGAAQLRSLERLLPAVDLATAAQQTGVAEPVLERLGTALARAQRPVVLPPGPALWSRRATATAGAVLLLNWALGAVGQTVHFPSRAVGGRRASYRATLELIDAMQAGQVQVLIIHDANPLYSLPAAAGFEAALERVPLVVTTAPMPDETSRRAHLILPDHTPLEAWGDAEPWPGQRSLVQPSLSPLYDTRALIDNLLDVARRLGATVPQDDFRTLLQRAWPGENLRVALARGGSFAPERPSASDPVADAPRLEVVPPLLEGEASMTLLALPSPTLYDGRGANLPWLQELPDPVTKIAWQSWAELSLATAKQLGGVGYGDILAIETQAGSFEVPAVPRGGVRDGVIAIAVGQGHSVGRYAAAEGGGPRGVSAIAALPSGTDESGGRAWLLTRATARATGAHQRLAFVQDSQDQRGRGLGRAVTLAALLEAAEDADHNGHNGDTHGGDGAHGEGHVIPFDPVLDSDAESPYRWGMAIDLDRCTGCSACVAACYVENNIPVVGEQNTLAGRHMAWLRIERWVGEGESRGGSTLPILPTEASGAVDIRHGVMLCQQCGAAPCEPVCPVIATYHNDEGLNGMVYNRCIGTRYCSNNCPYKVRKFNWFDFARERWPDPLPLMANPDVTLRSQGVMEKCTFCVQRVAAARQTAKDEGRPIADGEVTPACAQTCPANAIVFGNLKDPQSAVAARGGDRARGYHALQELNTRPAVTYLSKLRRGPVGS